MITSRTVPRPVPSRMMGYLRPPDPKDSPWLSWKNTPIGVAERLSYGYWRRARHLELLSRMVERVRHGPIRLIVEMPPRHGKSEMCSHYVPVWFLETFPDRRIILTSYEATFAATWGRKARNTIEAHQQELDIRIAQDSSAAGDWNVEGRRGGMMTAGVGGPITGRGSDLLIIDDPVKNADEANSATYRERAWQWWLSTARTRLEPGASVILIMCMTGDTPVLMADGAERPLREIQVGDEVATYDNGKLGTSTVRNHKSNGTDSVFRIRTTCGKIVYANERHPFLVQERGQLRWVRLKNLTTAHRIVTVKGSGASGKVRLVPSRAAKNLLAVGDTARRTTAKKCGPMGIVPHQLTQNHAGMHASNIGTESPVPSMTQCLKRKVASVLFADSLQGIMCALTGLEGYALITATTPTPSGGFCATTVISPWDAPSQKQPHSLSLNISDFTTEAIASIEPAGIEEVFDIQIERTENFIANGLVSHNTRWNEDDLAGRMIQSDQEKSEDAEGWEVLMLPALAEKGDPLGRAEGEALWPERYDEKYLLRTKVSSGPYWWPAQYQQRPSPQEGGIIKLQWFKTYRELPLINYKVQFWDTAFKKGQESDYSACVTMVSHALGYSVVDVQAKRLEFPELLKVAPLLAAKHKPSRVAIEDAASGQSLIQMMRTSTKLPIVARPVEGDKVARVNAITGYLEAGLVSVPEDAPWAADFLDELAAFPHGAHDDQVDAFVGAFNELRRMETEAVGSESIDTIPVPTRALDAVIDREDPKYIDQETEEQ